MTTGLPDATYWTGTDLEREYGKGYGPEDDLEAEMLGVPVVFIRWLADISIGGHLFWQWAVECYPPYPTADDCVGGRGDVADGCMAAMRRLVRPYVAAAEWDAWLTRQNIASGAQPPLL